MNVALGLALILTCTYASIISLHTTITIPYANDVSICTLQVTDVIKYNASASSENIVRRALDNGLSFDSAPIVSDLTAQTNGMRAIGYGTTNSGKALVLHAYYEPNLDGIVEVVFTYKIYGVLWSYDIMSILHWENYFEGDAASSSLEVIFPTTWDSIKESDISADAPSGSSVVATTSSVLVTGTDIPAGSAWSVNVTIPMQTTFCTTAIPAIFVESSNVILVIFAASFLGIVIAGFCIALAVQIICKARRKRMKYDPDLPSPGSYPVHDFPGGVPGRGYPHLQMVYPNTIELPAFPYSHPDLVSFDNGHMTAYDSIHGDGSNYSSPSSAKAEV